MTNSKRPDITVTHDNEVCIVCLNRPKHNNALTFSMLKQLENIAKQFTDDIQTRVVIFCAKGDNFSFGVDLADVKKVAASGTPLILRRRQLAQGGNLLQAIQHIPQITICAMQGMVIGGGAAIASACDFRIASSDCQISYGEVKLGMNLMWQALPICVQLIGPARAKKMVISGQFEKSSTLLHWGFLDEVAPLDVLQARADDMAKTYAALPPAAVQAIKQSINALSNTLGSAAMHMDVDQFLLLQNTEDAREAMTAMLEKRPGHYTGN